MNHKIQADRQTLQSRLESERVRIFEAMAVLQLVKTRLDQTNEEDFTDDLSVTLTFALEGAHKVLGNVASRLETIADQTHQNAAHFR